MKNLDICNNLSISLYAIKTHDSESRGLEETATTE